MIKFLIHGSFFQKAMDLLLDCQSIQRREPEEMSQKTQHKCATKNRTTGERNSRRLGAILSPPSFLARKQDSSQKIFSISQFSNKIIKRQKEKKRRQTKLDREKFHGSKYIPSPGGQSEK
jgi:hypothetical protein